MARDFVEKVIAYIKETYAAEPEFLWAKTPDNAVFRYQGNKKWFAALLLNLPKRKLGIEADGTVDVLNLKCDPLLSLVDYIGIFPGYHMNKEHWISILLDGSVPMEQIRTFIDLSYGMIAKESNRK